MLRALASLLLCGCLAGRAVPAPLTVPFDFSHGAIGIDVTVNGTALYVMVDTGVDPSIIDLPRARELHFKIDTGAGGEASGGGSDEHAIVYPSRIQGLVVGGHAFKPFDSLAFDMTALSSSYGRKLDGVLGFSFLKDKLVLIDYPAQRLMFLDRPTQVSKLTATCRTSWGSPLRTVEGFPIIPGFRLGAATGPVSIDTGSNGGIAIYQSALAMPGVRAALSAPGDAINYGGARGAATVAAHTFTSSVGFGPFDLPAGGKVTVRSEQGSASTRIANVGNAFFASMQLRILLDYPHGQLRFFGNCTE